MTDTAWPADAAQRRPLADLVPYARNSRTHSPDQVRQIAASMLEFGVTMPVLVDETGNIIAGHGRVMAAQYLLDSGHAAFGELPTVTAAGWPESRKRAYVIADNKLALNAGWDTSALALELQALMEDGFDTELTGFSEEEIAKLLPSEVGDLEPNDFQPEDAGESSTGTQSNTLKFAGHSIPMSQDEADRLKGAVEQYIEEKGVTYGFVATLLDSAVEGGFRG